MFVEKKWSLQRKKHLPHSQTWRRFSDVLGLLCCLWHWVPWMCSWRHEIRRLPRHFGAQCSTQCQKAGSPSKVMGLEHDNDPKHTSTTTQERFKTKRCPDCSEVASNEYQSKTHWTPVGRSENSSWGKALFKPGRTGAVCTRRVGQTASREV